MKATAQAFFAYLQKPIFLPHSEAMTPVAKAKTVGRLLLLDLALMLPTLLLLSVLEQTGIMPRYSDHLLEMLLSMPGWQVLLLACVLAPLLEELVFRAFLRPFAAIRPRWWGTVFPALFFISAVGFGLVHITNYDGTPHWLVWPLATLPQIVMGLLLGYVRIRCGLGWAMLFHGGHNAVFVSLFLAARAIDPSLLA
ncbi:MAG: CPBP family intramembrane metalloprotease [Cyclobacteriaceae bacterium]|nr:CPBP family intramembrane metalloprotease [Cyclobacteriaceae bacterium]